MFGKIQGEDFVYMTIERGTIGRGKIGIRIRQSARGLQLGLLGLACLAAVSVAASAQTKEVVLHNFCSLTNCADGANPSGVIRDSEGNLYGGTLVGGAHGRGVAYKLAPSGQVTVLYNFCSRGGDLCTDGWAASVSVGDSEGNLYGTANFGGAHNIGAVYELTGGKETVLHSFCSSKNCADGSEPGGGVIRDSAGNIYGVTLYGGASSNGSGVTSGAGVVYKLNASGKETVLYNFCSLTNCADGSLPSGKLLMDSEGNLYGTTINGGPNGGISGGDGVVYKLTSSGQETVLCSFGSASCPDGVNPNSGLIVDSEGNLYGTTGSGGAHGKGVVFELAPSGQETVLYNFCSLTNCADGEKPVGVVRDSEGNLYGSASNGPKTNPGDGLVYELSTSGSETVLCTFGSATCPGVSPSAVILDSEGNLYGTTYNGGANGAGNVFKLEP
jgi:uncharacterized repeat protein (TIGR03803 family)